MGDPVSGGTARSGAPDRRRDRPPGRAVRPRRPPHEPREQPDGAAALHGVGGGLDTQLAVSRCRLALGAQAGEARLRQVFEEAGYTQFRRAARQAAPGSHHPRRPVRRDRLGHGLRVHHRPDRRTAVPDPGRRE